MHQTKKRGITWGVAGILAVACACLVTGDTIYLKNGKTLEGLIKSETGTEVELDIGLGSIRLKRNRIEAIARSDQGETSSIKGEWKERYYTHPKYAPEEYGDLAQRYRGLQGLQKGAAEAHGIIHRVKEQQPGLRKQLRRVELELIAVSALLSGATPDRNVAAYNKLVERNNTVNANLVLVRGEILKNNRATEDAIKNLSNYMKHFEEFESSFQETYETFESSGAPESEQHFFESIRSGLDGMGRQVQNITIPHDDRFGHMIVEVAINDSGSANLMLDTGASVVTLSELAAKRLGLTLSDEKKGEFRLADGSVVEAHTVILDSVQVGDARVENVLAAVMPTPNVGGKDGLLGMSFLREFVMNYDAASSRLVLRRFAP